MHDEPSELAGKTVRIKSDVYHPQGIAGKDFRVEDWWDRVAGKSWMDCTGNPACLIYAMRNTPADDEVLYGKIGVFRHLIHISEIENYVEEM